MPTKKEKKKEEKGFRKIYKITDFYLLSVFLLILITLFCVYNRKTFKFDYGNLYKTYSYLRSKNAKQIIVFDGGKPLLIVSIQDMDLEEIDSSQEFINKIRPYVSFEIIIVSKMSIILNSVKIGDYDEKTKGINYSTDYL